MRRPLDQSPVSVGEKTFTIIWMNKINSRLGQQFVEVDTVILERSVIGIERATISSKYKEVLRREVQNLSKLRFLFANFFFGNFALFNFNTRAVPFDDLSRFVAQWFLTMKEPAIFPVSPPHSRLANERLSGFKRRAPFGYNCFYIFRMDHAGPAPPQQICQRETDIFQPAAVEEVNITIRQSGVNKRRSCIYQMAILALAGTQLLLRAFPVGDVDHSAHKFNEMAGRAKNRMT